VSRPLFAPADSAGGPAEAVLRRTSLRAGISERRASFAVAPAAAGVAVAARLPGALHYAFWQDEAPDGAPGTTSPTPMQ